MMSNVSIDINWINGVSLEKHCDQALGRATYYLSFTTQYEPGDFYPVEKVSFSLTPNAAAVTKFERIAAAIAQIMAEDDSEDKPMVEAFPDAAEPEESSSADPIDYLAGWTP